MEPDFTIEEIEQEYLNAPCLEEEKNAFLESFNTVRMSLDGSG